MDAAKLPAFAEQFDAVARERLTDEDLVPQVRVDLEVPIDAVGDQLEQLIRHFEPFGIGNPAPTFRTDGVQLSIAPRRIGTDGLRLMIEAPHGELEAVGWGMAPRMATLDWTRPLDVVYRLERDEYRGVSRLQLKMADLRG